MGRFFCCLVILAIVANVRGTPLVKREVPSAINPALQEVESADSARDKRKINHYGGDVHGHGPDIKDAVWGVKDAVLGFVFNKRSVGGFAWDKTTTFKGPTTPKGPTTTEDIVIFEKDQPVSLEVPDQLFGSTFSLVTNLSNTVGDFMINSALRAQRLLESMRPFLRSVFGAKGIVIEATTDKPIFSDPNSSR